MGIFSKRKKIDKAKLVKDKNDVLMADQIVFEKLTTDDDDYLTALAGKLMNHQPLILNFEPLNIDQANKVIAFFSGVTFAISGEIVHIQEKVFMFAGKDVYNDGSMDDFLKEIVE